MRAQTTTPQPAAETPVHDIQPRAQMSAGRRHLRRYACVLGMGLTALVYLWLVVRAAELDAQVGEVEKQMAEANFDLLQAKQEFFDQVCAVPAPAPAARQTPGVNAPAPEPPQALRIAGLPQLAPSVLADAAGWGALARVTPPPDSPAGGAVRLAQRR